MTATHALSNATLPYVLALADRGVLGAIEADPGLRPGGQRRRRSADAPGGRPQRRAPNAWLSRRRSPRAVS